MRFLRMLRGTNEKGNKGNESGFTLIELLVVIAIIGMLSSVVMASLNTARQKGRDARRLTDLRAIQTALELYANDYNNYPAQGPATRVSDMNPSLAPTYIPVIPSDPTRAGTGSDYRYCRNAAGYVLLTFPESKTYPSSYCSISNVSSTGTACWSSATYPPCNL